MSVTAPIAINARAAQRAETGGVERVVAELAARLPALAPDRYRLVAPPPALAHRAGHAWEQAALPLIARGAEVLFCPGNTAPLAGRRNAVLVHDLAPLVEPTWYTRAYRAWHRVQLRAVAARARLAITPSEFVRRELTDRLGMAPERTVAVPLAVDGRFATAGDPLPLRRRLGLADRPYVLAVGTDTARKNLALLDAIAPRLAAAGLDVAIAGGARDYMPSATAGAAAPGAARRLGYVAEADLPALYAGAAALALPSRYEGFGLPCLEAMAAGTPVVTTRAGALPETCGDAALYADPDDPAGFAEACLAAANDPSLGARLTAAGRVRAGARTWTLTAERVDAALGALLALP
ncbi:MAG: glycosyltransferase family 4 protein [Solirubrobacterales bacterium]|nr:glycosyltransferase family 4 protein [Solirubrobacterales bacterium]